MKTKHHSPFTFHDMMRRSFLVFLTALMATLSYAQKVPTGDLVYVFHKNGDVNAFLRSEITDIYYGFEDEDGVTFDEPVMQCIALGDSICKIPLSQIDSISFVTPPTVLQPGVTDLAPTLSQYVVDSKELTLYLSGSTPESLLPAVGTRVVLAERSFAGDVASVSHEDDRIVVRTSMVDLEEIFDTYYAVNVIDYDKEGNATARSKSVNDIDTQFETKITIPPVGMYINEEILNIILPLDDDIPVKASITSTIQPAFTIKASLVVNKEQGKRASVSIIGDYDLYDRFTFNGKLEDSHDFPLPKDVIDIPIGETFLFFYNRWGLFYKAAVELDIDLEYKQHYRSTFDWSYNSKAKQQKAPSATFKRTSDDFTPKGTLKGSITGGVFTELGIKFVVAELARAALRLEGGFELAGNYVLMSKDIAEASAATKLYELLKEQTVTLDVVVNSSLQFSFLDLEQGIDLPWNYKQNLATLYLVPEFKDTSLEEKYGSPSCANGSVSTTKRQLILPVEIGMRLLDGKGNAVADWKSPNTLFNGIRNIEHQFEGLDSQEAYKVHPTCKFLVLDMLASPAAPIERNPFPVRIVSFEQTGSHYSKQQGYEYDGRKYFYKFNATTTVELAEGVPNVKDWGYIYHDIYNQDKKISCANLGSKTYSDTRYAYYFNGPERTVSLSPYVQYGDGSEIQVGEKMKTFGVEYEHQAQTLCPDANHPHMIDLGLPSGTLWACCNVGASAPEDDGSRFDWGCTVPYPKHWYYDEVWFDNTYDYNLGRGQFQYTMKHNDSHYGWTNNQDDYDQYMIYDPEFDALLYDSLSTIPIDIAGTPFDAATKNWGAAWQTPTKEQMQELMDNCVMEPVIDGDRSNPVHFRFTGPNNKQILLPSTSGWHDYCTTYIRVNELSPEILPVGSEAVTEDSYSYHASYMTSSEVGKDGHEWFLYIYYRYNQKWDVETYKGIVPKTPEEKIEQELSDSYSIQAVRPVARKKAKISY